MSQQAGRRTETEAVLGGKAVLDLVKMVSPKPLKNSSISRPAPGPAVRSPGLYTVGSWSLTQSVLTSSRRAPPSIVFSSRLIGFLCREVVPPNQWVLQTPGPTKHLHFTHTHIHTLSLCAIPWAQRLWCTSFISTWAGGPEGTEEY